MPDLQIKITERATLGKSIYLYTRANPLYRQVSTSAQMPLYQELDRHTPPPPPYSPGQYNTDTSTSAHEKPQRSNPPPPPPTASSTSKFPPTIPYIRGLGYPTVSGDPNIQRNGDAVPLPAVPSQMFAGQKWQLGVESADHLMNEYRESIRFGIPVEPDVTPGFRAHPLRPFDQLPLERRSSSLLHQSPVYEPGIEIKSYHDTSTSQSPSMQSLGHNITPYTTQQSSRNLVTTDQQSLPTFSRHSSTIHPSPASTMTLDTPTSPKPFGTTPPQSNLPSQQGNEQRVTLPMVSTSQEPNTGRKISEVKSLPDKKADSNPHENTNDSHGVSTNTTTTPKDPHPASPARPSKTHTLQPPEKRRHGSEASHRRPSASVRFDPYKRRPSKVAGETERGLEDGAVGEDGGKATCADSDVEMEEGEEGKKTGL